MDRADIIRTHSLKNTDELARALAACGLQPYAASYEDETLNARLPKLLACLGEDRDFAAAAVAYAQQHPDSIHPFSTSTADLFPLAIATGVSPPDFSALFLAAGMDERAEDFPPDAVLHFHAACEEYASGTSLAEVAAKFGGRVPAPPAPEDPFVEGAIGEVQATVDRTAQALGETLPARFVRKTLEAAGSPQARAGVQVVLAEIEDRMLGKILDVSSTPRSSQNLPALQPDSSDT